jgi:methionyl-tRNA formyltransferase
MLVDAGFDVACVVTHRDDPSENAWFPSVRDLARKARMPVLLPKSARDPSVLSVLSKAKPDLILSVFYREILPANVLRTARVAAVNLHPALLPQYRGRASLNWAVIRGERRTGITLHHMVEKVDSGEIIGQEAFEIEREDTIDEVYQKTVTASRDILRRLLPAVLEGTAPHMPQDETKASYFGLRTPEDGRIDWNSSAEEIRNLVRGLTHPFPGAFTSIDGRRLWIWAAQATEGKGKPGSIICARDGALEVGTGYGRLAVTRAQLEGRKETDGASALGESPWSLGDRFDD